MNKAEPFELTEREVVALVEENNGNLYSRCHRIAERAFDALLAAAIKPVELCTFKNQYGWCKLDEGHKGSHTVINLGNDE